MEFVKLNKTKLEVSPICLGTVNYGTALSEADSKYQLSQFIDHGGNFIDSAHVYGDWEPGVLCRSERIIGEWIRETGLRDKVVIATKGSHPDLHKMEIPRVRPEDIRKDLLESLEYLNTDYIDLYFLHRDDPNIPVPEIIDYLDSAVTDGKIRYYGCSNWKIDRIQEAAAYARGKGSQGFVVNQLMWSLADINVKCLPDQTFVVMDADTLAYHHDTGMNAMAYMSIAKAYFTKSYFGLSIPEEVVSIYDNQSNQRIYEAALELVMTGEYSFIDLSLMYMMNVKDFPTIPIASFSNPEQLKTGLESWTKSKPVKLLEELGRMKKFAYFE